MYVVKFYIKFMKFNVVKFCTNLTKFFYKLRTSAKGEGGRGMSNADKCGQGGGGVQKMVILCGRPLWTTPINYTAF